MSVVNTRPVDAPDIVNVPSELRVYHDGDPDRVRVGVLMPGGKYAVADVDVEELDAAIDTAAAAGGSLAADIDAVIDPPPPELSAHDQAPAPSENGATPEAPLTEAETPVERPVEPTPEPETIGSKITSFLTGGK